MATEASTIVRAFATITLSSGWPAATLSGFGISPWYAFQAAQPATLAALNALAGASRAALATNVSGCTFNYSTGVLQHNGLVSISLTVTQSGESVTLQHQVNVDNVP